MRAREAGTAWSPTWSVPDFIGIFLLKMNNIILWFLLNNNKKIVRPSFMVLVMAGQQHS